MLSCMLRSVRSTRSGPPSDLGSTVTGAILVVPPAGPNLCAMSQPPDWRLHGVRVVRAGELDPNTAQTPGMQREAAITTARAGAEKLWAGTVVIHPDAKTGAHHHGPVESVIYVVSG